MKYQKGDIIPAEVTGIENYGFFVRIANQYNGLIHISEMIDGFVNNVNDYVKIGEIIHVHVLNIDDKTNQMKLSIKNINYRINDSNNNVEESLRGFLPLYEKLETWTNETLTELNENE